MMDIEVTGTPDPSVTWYKDDKPIEQAEISTHKIRKCGNSHTLIIEKGKNRSDRFVLYKVERNKIAHMSSFFGFSK